MPALPGPRGCAVALSSLRGDPTYGACRGSCGCCSFFSPQAARADDSPSPEAYRCDGEPPGPVLIGGNVVLGWRGLSLQLPRSGSS
jgi:hypothetical protein